MPSDGTYRFNIEHILMTVVAAVIIGIGSSYVTTQVQLGSLVTRMTRAEADIGDIKDDMDQMQDNLQPIRRDVIRLNTKMDILINSISDSTNIPNVKE